MGWTAHDLLTYDILLLTYLRTYVRTRFSFISSLFILFRDNVCNSNNGNKLYKA